MFSSVVAETYNETESRCRTEKLLTVRGAAAAGGGVGFTRTATATFDVFYWLQVTANFDDAPLLQSSPNGVNYNDIARFRLHGDS
jgi:hypothetical protein